MKILCHENRLTSLIYVLLQIFGILYYYIESMLAQGQLFTLMCTKI